MVNEERGARKRETHVVVCERESDGEQVGGEDNTAKKGEEGENDIDNE